MGQRRRYSDFLIHNIDECCWMKDAWPVKAQAIGGRHYRGDNVDQNFDNYSVEYTFADGAKLFLEAARSTAATTSSPATPTARRARRVISDAGHMPVEVPHLQGPGHDATPTSPGPVGKPEPNPYQTRVGRPDRGDPQGQAVQRGRARRRGQPAVP